MNATLLEMHILKWHCGYVVRLAGMKIHFFKNVECIRSYGVGDTGVDDPHGHKIRKS